MVSDHELVKEALLRNTKRKSRKLQTHQLNLARRRKGKYVLRHFILFRYYTVSQLPRSRYTLRKFHFTYILLERPENP